MGIRDSYENGAFSWVDLMTSEQEDAKQFYAELFGWTFEDMPTDMGGVYSMAYKGDRSVAAISALPPQCQNTSQLANLHYGQRLRRYSQKLSG